MTILYHDGITDEERLDMPQKKHIFPPAWAIRTCAHKECGQEFIGSRLCADNEQFCSWACANGMYIRKKNRVPYSFQCQNDRCGKKITKMIDPSKTKPRFCCMNCRSSYNNRMSTIARSIRRAEARAKK